MSSHQSGARFGQWEAAKPESSPPSDEQQQPRQHHHIHRQSHRPISHENRGRGDPLMFSLIDALSPEPRRISPLSHANVAAHTRALESKMTQRPSPRPMDGGSPQTPRAVRMFDPFARPPQRTPSPAVNARGTQSPNHQYSSRIFDELAALIDSSRSHRRNFSNNPSPNKHDHSGSMTTVDDSSSVPGTAPRFDAASVTSILSGGQNAISRFLDRIEILFQTEQQQQQQQQQQQLLRQSQQHRKRRCRGAAEDNEVVAEGACSPAHDTSTTSDPDFVPSNDYDYHHSHSTVTASATTAPDGTDMDTACDVDVISTPPTPPLAQTVRNPRRRVAARRASDSSFSSASSDSTISDLRETKRQLASGANAGKRKKKKKVNRGRGEGRTGRPSSCSERVIRIIEDYIRTHEEHTQQEITAYLADQHHIIVSRPTVCRWIQRIRTARASTPPQPAPQPPQPPQSRSPSPQHAFDHMKTTTTNLTNSSMTTLASVAAIAQSLLDPTLPGTPGVPPLLSPFFYGLAPFTPTTPMFAPLATTPAGSGVPDCHHAHSPGVFFPSSFSVGSPWSPLHAWDSALLTPQPHQPISLLATTTLKSPLTAVFPSTYV